jgi:F420-non-reducing hydrogenase iron-sulfur subunit
VGFLCNWCSYGGADAAGSQRKTYAPNVRVIRVMCTGRVEPEFVLKAFQSGADGVLILGCHPGDCHYKEGNYKALRRYYLLKKVLSQFGIEEERLRLDWVSATEADKFVDTINDMVATIKALGPLALSNPALAKGVSADFQEDTLV